MTKGTLVSRGTRRIVTSWTIVMTVCAIAASSAAAGEASGLVSGKVRGFFHRDCFVCGDSAKYIAANNVWCAWQGDHVVVHVTFKNRSVEGLKVTWHPSYTIRNGSDHGGGLTSLQDTKLAGGESKSVSVSQSPKDTPVGAAIAVCKPSFYLVGH